MNKKHIISSLLISTLALGAVSCGPLEGERYPWELQEKEADKKQEKDSKGNKGAENLEVLAQEMKAGMAKVLNPVEHKYQYQRANSIDVYAGYWTVSQNKFLYGGALPTTYTFPNPYLGGPYGETLTLFPLIKNGYFHSEALGAPYIKAIATIMFDKAIVDLADIYGPLPFDDLRKVKKFPPLTYISDKEVYTRVFAELAEAIKSLKELKPSKEELAKIEGENGGLSRGEWRNWVKFANSYRLQMAMNIVKKDPALAQEQAELSVNDEIGVFTDADGYDFTQDRLYCDWIGDNPLHFISQQWDDLRLGASLENILKRYRNPLLGQWFTKNPYAISNSKGQATAYSADVDYVGIRQGVAMINKTDKKHGYGPFSAPSERMKTMPLPWMKRTEVLFNMAEGALRGWNMGATAQNLYERGIRLSFLENGLTEDDVQGYLTQTDVEQVDYVDPYNEVNNIKGRVTIGVKWSESDDNEKKLERIITQKYIAVFPSSLTTWTTFRRTGYPRLFPVYLNNWPGMDAEIQIRRIPYIETPNNREELAKLPALMNGQPNTAMSRLWWDVPTEERGESGDDKAKTARVIPHNF